MACASTITSGIAKGCKDNSGGVQYVYIASADNVASITSATGSVSAISMTGSTKFWKFEVNKNTSKWAQTIKGKDNGVVSFEQILTLVIPANSVNTRNQILLLASGEMKAIVYDTNSKNWLLGEKFNLNLNAGTSDSGTMLNDDNIWTLTISGEEKEPAKEVLAAALTTIVG